MCTHRSGKRTLCTPKGSVFGVSALPGLAVGSFPSLGRATVFGVYAAYSAHEIISMTGHGWAVCRATVFGVYAAWLVVVFAPFASGSGTRALMAPVHGP